MYVINAFLLPNAISIIIIPALSFTNKSNTAELLSINMYNEDKPPNIEEIIVLVLL